MVNNQSLLQLSQRIDVLEAQMRELRGKLEELQNSNETLRKQQRDLYADLDRRLDGAAGRARRAARGRRRGDGAGAGSGRGLPAAMPAGGDQAAYKRAFDALKPPTTPARSRVPAISCAHYPQSQLAGNAQYWLGEAYYVTRDYDNAAAAFRAVGEQYPQSPKVPDALLKLGMTQIDQKQLADARATLKQVVQRYPGHRCGQAGRPTRLQTIPPDAALGCARIERAAQAHGDLLLAAGRGRHGRDSDRVRAPDRLPAALPVLRYRLCLPRRRVVGAGGHTRARAEFGARYVCVTGGEPLAQPPAWHC